MRVCLVSQEYPSETGGGGGIGTQTYLKAHGLASRGHNVTVVTSTGEDRDALDRDGEVDLIRLAWPQLPVPGYELASTWLAYSNAVARKLTELTSTSHFDIIQFPEFGGEGFAFQTDTYAHRTAKYVVQTHGPLGMFADEMGWPTRGSTLHRIGTFLEETVLHHADLILASSRHSADYCARNYGCHRDAIHVIHSGIDTEFFSTRRLPDSFDGLRSPRILFVGKLAANKGFDVLIDAVLRLRDVWPGIVARCIGRGNQAEVDSVLTRIEEEKAHDNVELTGYVPYRELPQHYAWCDVFVGPSIHEPGPGNVYLEAMACGRPVVACNTGGTPEAVIDGRSGILVPSSSVEELAAAITALAADRSRCRLMGEWGRQWVIDNFSIQSYIDKVERHYLEVIG
jgi:glycosyltransferase involved in cell wall biosynthesis